MSVLATKSNVLALLNSIERVDITVQDADTAQNVDPFELLLTVTDIGGTEKVYDSYPSPATRIIRSAVGRYYINFGYPEAVLSGSHSIGATTLVVIGAYPAGSNSWPSTGNVIVGAGSTKETIGYSSVSISSGVGSFTLTSPLTINHSSGEKVRGSNSETNSPQEWLFNWQIKMIDGDEQQNVIQKVKVITHKVASLLSEFRVLIDKSSKLISPSSECFLGYTDSNLISYLEGGLGTINAYQPSLTFTFENFPLEYRQILLDAGLITGVMSQQLYAIDTDIPNYNDQGTSFVIVHQPQLASFLNQVSQRLDRLIPMMKLQLIQPGSLHIQAGPNFRLNQLMQAAPSGAIFRNVFFKG
jgi:hypothetical protein